MSPLSKARTCPRTPKTGCNSTSSPARAATVARKSATFFSPERIDKAGLSRRSSDLRSEGGIHAGQRDEFGQEFFRARHAPTA